MDNSQIGSIKLNEGLSARREQSGELGERVHHVAFEINGMKRVLSDLAESNMVLEQYEDGRYVDKDTFEGLTALIELLVTD